MDVMTVQQAAEILGVIPRRIREMIAEGKLDARRFGRRNWAIEKESVERHQALQQAQKAWTLLGITRRIWGAWWLSDIDEVGTLECPNCAGVAYSPAGDTKYSAMSACPSCGWAERPDEGQERKNR